jgi:hypothetical protein
LEWGGISDLPSGRRRGAFGGGGVVVAVMQKRGGVWEQKCEEVR